MYDGDGNPSINSGHRRVKATVSGVTTTFIGTPFEWTGSTSTMVKSYVVYPESMRRAGSQRLAMRTGGSANANLTWLFGDHLGSTSVTADLDGDVISRTLYKPWGEVRYQSGTLPTKYTYTGQYSESYINLLFYGSRRYDPALGRFIQPDTIIPGQNNPMAWDRYAYVMNAPTRYTDPSGHWYYDPGCECLVETDDNSKNEHPDNLDYERDYNEDEGNPLDDILRDKGISDPDYYSLSIYSTVPIKILAVLLGAGSVLTPVPDEAGVIPASVMLFLQNLVSAGFAITIDRNGQLYLTPGISAGKTIVPVVGDPNVTFAVGWTETENPQDVLAGPSVSVGATAAILGANFIFSPSGNAGEVTGSVSPSVYGTFTIGIPIIRLPISWPDD